MSRNHELRFSPALDLAIKQTKILSVWLLACLIPIRRRAFYIHSEKPPASCSQIQT